VSMAPQKITRKFGNIRSPSKTTKWDDVNLTLPILDKGLVCTGPEVEKKGVCAIRLPPPRKTLHHPREMKNTRLSF